VGPDNETAECDKGVCQQPESPKQENPPAENMPNEQAAAAQKPEQDAQDTAGETAHKPEGQAVEQAQ